MNNLFPRVEDIRVTTTASAADTISIRSAKEPDLLAVFRIEKASFDQPWPFSAFERYLDEPTFLVAEDDAKVVGYVVADVVPNHGRGLGHVKDIAVHPTRRGEGIGSKLLERALAGIGSRGAHSVKLEVRESNESAIDLYREFGFQYLRTVPRYYDDGEDALVMVVELN
ncbi:ribosomal-protein-alanine N-acetyltransferase [halophilic archaeon]|nr:ribosomal-protein-alanine N-acetyltransferase [halophilic archaeon]